MERTSSPDLLPIFRSRQQAELLSWLLDHPDDEVSISDLAGRVGAPITSAHREVQRAEEAGLVRSRRIGNLRLVSPDTTSPYYDDLRSVLTRAFGPPRVLATALADITGIDAAYLFGSWAARWHGEGEARPVGDIDLLVLGEPDRTEVYAALASIEPRLGREVQVTFRPSGWLASGSGSFHDTVAGRPLVPLDLGQAPVSAAATRSTAPRATS